MKLFVLSTLIFFSLAHAFSPPIDGGKNAPLTSMDYVDVVELNGSSGSICTGTKVSPTKILTAAHCIEYFTNPDFIVYLKVGDVLPNLGKITAINVHPKYRSAKITEDIKLFTLYDIAFISIEERPSQRKIPYPQIISKDHRPLKRAKLELAGYGTKQVTWNETKFENQTGKMGFQIGNNSWVECPVDYFDPKVNELEKMNKKIQERLRIKSSRMHIISSGSEIVEDDGTAMVLGGDSGSPSLERGSDNRLIVTGVASNVTHGAGEPSLEVVFNGEVFKESYFEMPKNWGSKKKSDSDFKQIQAFLKKHELLDESGQIKTGVEIKRKYKRISTGRFADLSHPINQEFIQDHMK